MATWLSNPANDLDAWWVRVNGATQYGNGKGVRLTAGEWSTGGDTWENRFGSAIKISGLFALLANADQMTAATLTYKVKGSGGCHSSGSSPQIYFERLTGGDVGENVESGDCSVSTAGTVGEGRWPGPTSDTTNRVTYAPGSEPAAGTTISLNVLAMLKDAYNDDAAATYFQVRAIGVSESTASHRLTVYSRHSSGNEPKLSVTYSTNSTPSVPSVSLSPVGRITGATAPTFSFDFTDADGEQCHQCYIQVSTDITFGSVTKWDSGWLTPTTATGGRATRLYTGGALVRGTQYYWRVKVRDVALAASGYSAAVAFDVNEYPVATTRTPA